MHNCSSNLSFILFADDTNLFRSGKDLKQLEIEINYELILVQNWLKGQWHRKFLLAISILLDDLTMKILSFRSQTF
jgi:hypothetical protein